MWGSAFLRLCGASQISDDVDNPTGNKILWDSGFLNGAPHKVHLQPTLILRRISRRVPLNPLHPLNPLQAPIQCM